jgi:hypothetical protein
MPTASRRGLGGVVGAFLRIAAPLAIGCLLVVARVDALVLTRYPSIWLRTPGSVVVAWQTDVPSGGTVLYGFAPELLDRAESQLGPVTDHAIELTGLSPGTNYFYRIVAGPDTLTPGVGHFRRTSSEIHGFAPALRPGPGIALVGRNGPAWQGRSRRTLLCRASIGCPGDSREDSESPLKRLSISGPTDPPDPPTHECPPSCS